MILQINGKVEKVLPLQSGTSTTGKQWTKRDFVVVDNPNDEYPDRVCLTAFGERINDIPQVGSRGVFEFNLDARETARGIFNSNNFIRFTPAQPEPPSQDTSPQDDTSPCNCE